MHQMVMVVRGVLGRVVRTVWILIDSQTGVEEASEILVRMMEVVEGHSILEMTEDMKSLLPIELVAEDHILLQTDL